MKVLLKSNKTPLMESNAGYGDYGTIILNMGYGCLWSYGCSFDGDYGSGTGSVIVLSERSPRAMAGLKLIMNDFRRDG